MRRTAAARGAGILRTMVPDQSGPSEPGARCSAESSRRAHGAAIWAALRSCEQARTLADRLQAAGLDVVNRVILNQVLVRGCGDEDTTRIREHVIATDAGWFSTTIWQGRQAIRLLLSSWRTGAEDIERPADAFVDAVR
ncbi:hypothetical protein [Microbacterium sp.]|uniref:hypothetical protein n=1 Tax=Microbacterium sp. TaxID=51671 RepID=UPI003C1806F4